MLDRIPILLISEKKKKKGKMWKVQIELMLNYFVLEEL